MAYPNPTFQTAQILTTPPITDSSTNAANTAFVNAAIDNISGRNLIINGGCQVQQYPSQGYTTGLAGYGAVDRVKVINASTAGTLIASSTTYNNANGVAVPMAWSYFSAAAGAITGGGYIMPWQYIVEGYDCYAIVGKVLSLQFTFYASVSGTYSVSFSDSTGANTYTTTFNYTTASQPQNVQLQIPAVPNGAVLPRTNGVGLIVRIAGLATGTFMCPTASLGAWSTANYVSAQGSTNWANAINQGVGVTNVQLEIGSACTSFESEPIAITFEKCLRYRWWQNETYLGWGSWSSAASAYIQVKFPTPMRILPSMTLNGTFVCNSASGGNAAVGSIVLGGGSVFSALLTVGSSGGTGGYGAILETTNAAYGLLWSADF
jgi:hypothetical protein